MSQDYPGSVQIIVVDDGSTDDTPSLVQSFRSVEYVYQENSGPAQARNKGASLARGQLIAFIDSDCIPYSDWLSNLIAAFTSDDIGAVCGTYDIANPESLLARCIQAEISYRHARFGSKDVRFFGSYNVCIPREVFIRSGGYNKGFRNASNEDNDLSYRILQLGLKIRFESKALVKHYHPEKIKKYLHEQYIHGFWRARLYRTHPGMMKGDDYTFWKDILEPIGVLVSGMALLMVPYFGFVSFYICAYLILVLWGMEIGFSFSMNRNPKASLWFAWIMFLRAVFRTLGFVYGFIIFLFSTPSQNPQ